MALTVLDNMEYGSDTAAQAAYIESEYNGEVFYNGSKTVVTFKKTGKIYIPSGITLDAEVLVVAGGGAGGTWCGGGGGGGGVIHVTSKSISSGNHDVTVGNGGTKPTANGTGSNGQNSVFGDLTAIGGGGGGAYPTYNGSNGGSGGGAGWYSAGTPGGGTSNQGYSGGKADANNASGGGGGAGSVGADADGNKGGNGGNGVSCSIIGSENYYGGGGGGFSISVPVATGGLGGGGNGDQQGSPAATDGESNTGGGGGGGWYANNGYYGGAGGSGIVIISFDTADYDYSGSIRAFSEPTIITESSYSLKGIASQTTSLNKTLTRTITSPINLTGHAYIVGKIRSNRTGSNIKIGFHDSGGTTTEITPNITAADTWQNIQLDISGVSDANKDAIDQIIITVVNADADNTFYLDNFFASDSTDFGAGTQVSKAVGYAVLTPIEAALNVSKVVGYAVLIPISESSDAGPMVWIF